MTSKPVFQNLELQPIAGQWRAGGAGDLQRGGGGAVLRDHGAPTYCI